VKGPIKDEFAIGKSQGAGAGRLPCSRFSELSWERQFLARLCQVINFGEIREIEVRNREPIFGSVSRILVDLRLDNDESSRPESTLLDFNLSHELCRLFAEFDQLENAQISRIEIRAGLPRRILFEAPIGSLLR
jgi:hypothetical protein